MPKSKNALPYLDLYGEALSAYTKAVLGANELMIGYSSAIFRTLLTPVAPGRGTRESSVPAATAPASREPAAASAVQIVEAEQAPSVTEDLLAMEAAPVAIAEMPHASNDPAVAHPEAPVPLNSGLKTAAPERSKIQPSKMKQSKTKSSKTKPSESKSSKPAGRRKK